MSSAGAFRAIPLVKQRTSRTWYSSVTARVKTKANDTRTEVRRQKAEVRSKVWKFTFAFCLLTFAFCSARCLLHQPSRLLTTYLDRLEQGRPSSAACAVYASLDAVGEHSPLVAASIIREFRDQRRSLKLIARENYSSLATQLAHGNLLTD